MSNVIDVDVEKSCATVTVSVNEKEVVLKSHRVTGLEVKKAAIDQGVTIDLGFVLSMITGGGKAKITGDEDVITVNKNSVFIATAHDDNSEGPISVTPEVSRAIDEIKGTFPESELTVRSDGDGGAYVMVDQIFLGEQYLESEYRIGFHITFQYPFSDVYPHFVTNELKRKDGKPLGEGMSSSTFESKPAVQISRRSNHLDPNRDTALLKLLKVIDWVRGKK